MGEVSGPPPPGRRGDLAGAISYLAQLSAFASVAALSEGLGVLATIVRSASKPFEGSVLASAEAILGRLRLWLEDRWLADDQHRFLWEVADLTLATMCGLIRHGVMSDPRGLDAIDDYECREWLRMNGASVRALQSPFLRGLYDLSMGYEDGDPERPRLSAGQGLRGTLRTFFGYRGAFMWRMRAGMGDVVFAPPPTRPCVAGAMRFEFFHRLTNVGLPPDPPEEGSRDHVRRLTFDVQARPRDGGVYAPLVAVMDRPCWPSAPDFAQLEDAATASLPRGGTSNPIGIAAGSPRPRWKSAATSTSPFWASAWARCLTSAARSWPATRAGGG